MSDEPRPRPSLWARLARLLVRLTLVAVLGALLGAAAYFGPPALYRAYIEPVQIHTQRIAELERALGAEQAQSARERVEILNRLAAAEGRLTALGEEVAALQDELRTLSGAARTQRAEVTALAGRAAALEAELQGTAQALAELQGGLAGAPAQQLARQVQLLRALDLLTRARLWLMQDNQGLAAEDVRQAREIVAATSQASPPEQAAALGLALERLDLALRDLRLSPVVAADDLEIAWRMLLAAAAPPAATPTPETAGETP